MAPDPSRLASVGAGGTPTSVLLCGDDGRGSDIMTDESFAGHQLHVRFTVESNSGVYSEDFLRSQNCSAVQQGEAGLSRLLGPFMKEHTRVRISPNAER